MAEPNQPKQDQSTEEKIRQAARKVFTRKGYSAARTRDIADEAGINLALLNYYFRSKEKLFDMVMMENLQQFLQGIREIFEDEKLSLNEQVKALVERYIGMLQSNPELPLFILHELRVNPEKFSHRTGVKNLLYNTHFFRQIVASGNDIHPVHFVINLLSLTIFPFVAKPLIQSAVELDGEAYQKLMNERIQLIPQWINNMFHL